MLCCCSSSLSCRCEGNPLALLGKSLVAARFRKLRLDTCRIGLSLRTDGTLSRAPRAFAHVFECHSANVLLSEEKNRGRQDLANEIRRFIGITWPFVCFVTSMLSLFFGVSCLPQLGAGAPDRLWDCWTDQVRSITIWDGEPVPLP